MANKDSKIRKSIEEATLEAEGVQAEQEEEQILDNDPVEFGVVIFRRVDGTYGTFDLSQIHQASRASTHEEIMDMLNKALENLRMARAVGEVMQVLAQMRATSSKMKSAKIVDIEGNPINAGEDK